jgi:hypothetical protein
MKNSLGLIGGIDGRQLEGLSFSPVTFALTIKTAFAPSDTSVLR